MSSNNEARDKLLRLAAQAESRNLDGVSARIAAAIRELNAASLREAASSKESKIEIESWPDFLNWWNNNRGQNLVYIFMDSYGHGAEQVQMVKKLVNAAEKHEKDLHEFYMKLRDMTQAPGAPGGAPAAPGADAAPAAPAADEPALDDAGLDEDAGDMDLDAGDEADVDDDAALDELANDLGE
jgi:hypothetical protein